MDEATERKIRDLKLKILLTEKELNATQHTLSLGSWLRAGHAGQLARTAERDRLRLEARLAELREKLAALVPEAPSSGASAEPEPTSTASAASTRKRKAPQEKKPAAPRKSRKPKT